MLLHTVRGGGGACTRARPRTWFHGRSGSAKAGDKLSTSREWTTHSSEWISDSTEWTSDSKEWTVDPQEWTVDPQEWTVDPQEWTVDSTEWTVDSREWTVHSSAGTTHSRGFEPKLDAFRLQTRRTAIERRPATKRASRRRTGYEKDSNVVSVTRDAGLPPPPSRALCIGQRSWAARRSTLEVRSANVEHGYGIH